MERNGSGTQAKLKPSVFRRILAGLGVFVGIVLLIFYLAGISSLAPSKQSSAPSALAVPAATPAPSPSVEATPQITPDLALQAEEAAFIAAVQAPHNDLSDIGNDRLVLPGTPLYEALLNLKEGDKIRFSGRFKGSSVDWVEEKSLGLEGSMSDPEFL
jgi:hypothetical protein